LTLRARKLYQQAVQAWRAGRVERAEALLVATLESDPAHADALSDLGALRQSLDRHEEAIVLYESALAVDGEHLRALRNLARAQEHLDRLGEASATLLRLAQLDRAEAAAYLIREALLVHLVAPDADYPQRVRSSIVAKLAAIKAAGARMTRPLRFPSTYFALSYHGLCNKELVQCIADAHTTADPRLEWTAPQAREWTAPKGRIRVGVASRFLRGHSIGNTSRGLVRHLDRASHEVVVIRFGATAPDSIAAEIDAAADRVVVVPYDDLAAAREAIARLSLDVLFYQDVGMEPLSYLLAFSRLAPVQLTSFGHPETTGVRNMDYFLSSANYECDEAQTHYAERLIMVPDAGTLSYYYRPPASSGRARDDFGFAAADHLYLCPQSLFKIHPDMDAMFKAILENDAVGKIVLIDSRDQPLREPLERRLAATLGTLAQRVRFVPPLPYPDFLSLIECADVMLDTPRFNGQNTTLEALAKGCPVVTLPGRLQRERHTYGMYRAMGFMELIADSAHRYAALAVRVANDAAFRDHCRARIAATRDVLYENAAFVRNCEQAFRVMIEETKARASAPRTR
jgi:protein O-GlcNAc transferase